MMVNCRSWEEDNGWATLYSVKSTLWSAVCAWRKKWDMYRKATQGKDTEGQMLSKQFEFQWVQWESIGDPDKHLNCVMWLCLSFRIGLAAICWRVRIWEHISYFSYWQNRKQLEKGFGLALVEGISQWGSHGVRNTNLAFLTTHYLGRTGSRKKTGREDGLVNLKLPPAATHFLQQGFTP